MSLVRIAGTIAIAIAILILAGDWTAKTVLFGPDGRMARLQPYANDLLIAHPDLSSDGSKLVFDYRVVQSETQITNRSLAIYDFSTGTIRKLIPPPHRSWHSASYSPDDELLVLVQFCWHESCAPEELGHQIGIINIKTEKFHRITNGKIKTKIYGSGINPIAKERNIIRGLPIFSNKNDNIYYIAKYRDDFKEFDYSKIKMRNIEESLDEFSIGYVSLISLDIIDGFDKGYDKIKYEESLVLTSEMGITQFDDIGKISAIYQYHENEKELLYFYATRPVGNKKNSIDKYRVGPHLLTRPSVFWLEPKSGLWGGAGDLAPSVSSTFNHTQSSSLPLAFARTQLLAYEARSFSAARSGKVVSFRSPVKKDQCKYTGPEFGKFPFKYQSIFVINQNNTDIYCVRGSGPVSSSISGDGNKIVSISLTNSYDSFIINNKTNKINKIDLFKDIDKFQ
mgnify:CR=1 FL=1